MQNNKNNLGVVLKSARLNKGYTREQLSEKLHISTRYLTGIEVENRKPSYNVLYKIVRELGVPGDAIFYPEMAQDTDQKEQLVRMINRCDEHGVKVLFATAGALLDQQGM